jgi:hypothetical protein
MARRAVRSARRSRRRAPVRAGHSRCRRHRRHAPRGSDCRQRLPSRHRWRTHLPAAVDDFLRAPLHFGVAALHRGEVEILAVAAGGHRTGGAAAEADQHAGAADLDEQRAGRERFGLERLAGRDVADAAGDHDRFVVAAHQPLLVTGELLVGAEIAGQVRAAELVVEGGGADRTLEHDGQRRGDACRAAVGGRRALPRLECASGILRLDTEKPHRPAFGFEPRPVAPSSRISPPEPVAAPGRAKSPSGGCAFRPWPGCASALRDSRSDHRRPGKTRHAGAFDDRRVVGIGDDGPAGCAAVRFADHAEQRFVARLPSMTQEALKILCRQCSELACANIISSTSVGLRPAARTGRRGNRLRRPTAPARAGLASTRARDRRPADRHRSAAAARNGGTEVGGLREVVEHGLQHAVMEQRGDIALSVAGRTCAGALRGGRRCRVRCARSCAGRCSRRCRWLSTTRARWSRCVA